MSGPPPPQDLKFRQLLARRLLVSAPLPHHLPCKLAVTVAMGAMGGHPSPNMALSNFTVCNDGDMTVMTTQQVGMGMIMMMMLLNVLSKLVILYLY